MDGWFFFLLFVSFDMDKLSVTTTYIHTYVQTDTTHQAAAAANAACLLENALQFILHKQALKKPSSLFPLACSLLKRFLPSPTSVVFTG